MKINPEGSYRQTPRERYEERKNAREHGGEPTPTDALDVADRFVTAMEEIAEALRMMAYKS